MWGNGGRAAREITYPVHLSRLLRLSGERGGDGAGQRGQQEAAAVHPGMVGRMGAKVNGTPDSISFLTDLSRQRQPGRRP